MTIKKNILFILVEKIYTFSLGFYLLILISNYLGVERYGIYSYSIAVVLLSLSFVKLGLNHLIVNYLVLYTNNINNILFNTFLIKLFFGFLGSICVYVFLNYKIIEYNTSIISIVLILYSLEVFEFWIQSLRKNYIASLFNMLSISIIFIVTYYFIQLNLNLEYFIIVYIFTLTFKYILLSFYFFIINENFFNQLSQKKIKFIFFKTKYLFFASIFTASFMQIDQIMIENMLGIKSLGDYSLAVNLNNYLFIIPVTFFMVILPYLSKYNKIYDFKIFNYFFVFFSSILFYLLFFSSIFLFLFSTEIFNYLFSLEFKNSLEIYNVLLFSLPLVGVNYAFYNYFVIIKRNDVNLKATFIGLLSNILFNFIFLNKFGTIGAAYASILAYTIMIFISYSFLLYKNKNILYIIFPFSYLKKNIKYFKVIKEDL